MAGVVDAGGVARAVAGIVAGGRLARDLIHHLRRRSRQPFRLTGEIAGDALHQARHHPCRAHGRGFAHAVPHRTRRSFRRHARHGLARAFGSNRHGAVAPGKHRPAPQRIRHHDGARSGAPFEHPAPLAPGVIGPLLVGAAGCLTIGVPELGLQPCAEQLEHVIHRRLAQGAIVGDAVHQRALIILQRRVRCVDF